MLKTDLQEDMNRTEPIQCANHEITCLHNTVPVFFLIMGASKDPDHPYMGRLTWWSTNGTTIFAGHGFNKSNIH